MNRLSQAFNNFNGGNNGLVIIPGIDWRNTEGVTDFFARHKELPAVSWPEMVSVIYLGNYAASPWYTALAKAVNEESQKKSDERQTYLNKASTLLARAQDKIIFESIGSPEELLVIVETFEKDLVDLATTSKNKTPQVFVSLAPLSARKQNLVG